jgi:hypothetical protein
MCSLLQFVNRNSMRYLIVLYWFPSSFFSISVHKTYSVSLFEHIFAHNTHFRGPVTGFIFRTTRDQISAPKQLPNRYFVLFLRLSQQNPTQYLKLHNCDRYLHMLSCSLFTKHRTIQHYKGWATDSTVIFPHGATAPLGQGFLIVEAPRSDWDTT